MNIYELEQLPIPNANNEQQAKIVALVDMILALKKPNPQADTSTEETTINQLVYKLYQLNENEINLIEKL